MSGLRTAGRGPCTPNLVCIFRRYHSGGGSDQSFKGGPQCSSGESLLTRTPRQPSSGPSLRKGPDQSYLAWGNLPSSELWWRQRWQHFQILQILENLVEFSASFTSSLAVFSGGVSQQQVEGEITKKKKSPNSKTTKYGNLSQQDAKKGPSFYFIPVLKQMWTVLRIPCLGSCFSLRWVNAGWVAGPSSKRTNVKIP